ncbi:hypothetical protein KJ596_00625 [Patescibacteria group bacterium]|nr:hypothetical protein [Patescibacteria group bacterium]MBU1867959.1 hypothetical protein [Patescibacteria group bacterium]
MKLKDNNTTKGFSLIGLLVYTVLAAIVLLILPQFISQVLSFRVQSQQFQVLDRAGFHILQQITQKIRYSDDVDIISGDQLRVEKSGSGEVIFVQDSVLYLEDEGTGVIESFMPSGVYISDYLLEDVSFSNEYPSVRIAFTLRDGSRWRTFATAASRRLQEKAK